MKTTNVTTLIMGFALILWAGLPIDGKPVNVNFQILESSVGIVLCCASFAFYIIDAIKEIKK